MCRMRSASATNDPCRGFGPFPGLRTKKGILHRCVILFCIKSIASKGRPEGFQRAIGKPFGRARRRETSDLGKAIVLSENSMSVHVLLLLVDGLDRIRTQLVKEALLRLGNRASLTSWIICFFDFRNQVMDKTESYDLYPSIHPGEESDGTDLEGNLQARLQNEAFQAWEM